MSREKSYLVFGGCGFVGRNIVSYLVEQEAVETVIVADKSRPEISWLTGPHKATFKNPKVKFKQSNLHSADIVKKLFSEFPCDYVINCSGESKYGMTEDVYNDSIYKVGINIANECVIHKIKKFVQISTSEVYAANKEVKKINSKIEPWSPSAKAYSKLDKELLAMKNLNFIILRPALVYGHGDLNKLMPRIIVTAVYKILKEKMKLLWTKDLRINTVHADDVSGAAFFCCTHDVPSGVYILADKSNSTQGSITASICNVFGVEHEYFSGVESNFAKMSMKTVVEEINEKHMTPWSEICSKENIMATPLSPYLDKELLYKHHICVDGSEIEQTGFTYRFPQFDEKTVLEVVKGCIEEKIFPESSLS